MAATLARQPDVRASLRDEVESPRRLFAAIDTLLDPAAEGPALTIYGASGRPLAWAGRPSELPRERVLDGANLFVAHAALGLRLVAVEPIAESERNARRLGTVAAEARLSVPDASRQGETYVVETAYGPVTFRRSFGERDPDAKGFVIAGPNGAPLLEATIAPDAGDAARSVWLMRVDRLALAALALVLVVAATIVVLERQGRRQPRARAGATALAITLVWLAWLAATVAVARGAARGPIDLGHARRRRDVAGRLRRDRAGVPRQRDAPRRSGQARHSRAARPAARGRRWLRPTSSSASPCRRSPDSC